MHLRKTDMFIILSVGFPDNFRFASRKGARPGMLRLWGGSLLFKHSFLTYLRITPTTVDSQRDSHESLLSLPTSPSFPLAFCPAPVQQLVSMVLGVLVLCKRIKLKKKGNL